MSPILSFIGKATRLATLCVLLAAISLIGIGCTQNSDKASYPTKAIDVIVPFSAGGGTDVVGRIIAEYVSAKWGQPVNVVNKPGGGGTPGTVEMLAAPADGYTMTITSASATYLNMAFQKDLPYKWDDMTYVARVVLTPQVLVVKADSPFNSLKDLMDAIKKDPSSIKFGAGGMATASTLGFAQLLASSGVDPTKVDVVVFQGGGPTVTAVAGGHVHFAVQNLSEVLELVKGGNLKALAVTTPERSPELPDVPTSKEAGFEALSQVGVFGVAGPGNLPQDVVAKWETTLEEAMRDSSFTTKLVNAGNMPAYLNSREYREWTESQVNTAIELATNLNLRK